ncbi:MAG: cyanophycin synthetase [Deltaproteobacteria bacterium]
MSQLKSTGWKITDEAIRSGLGNTFWPGRLEIVQTSPRVLLDGAHNAAGIRALFRSLTNEFEYDKLRLIFGVMEDKNYRQMIQHALKFSDSFYFIELPLKRSLTAGKLRCSLHRDWGLARKIIFRKELREVLPELVKRCGVDDLICVTGSLYAVSEAKKCLARC